MLLLVPGPGPAPWVLGARAAAGKPAHRRRRYEYPGGRAEPGDASPRATACREVHEETAGLLRLAPGELTLLGVCETGYALYAAAVPLARAAAACARFRGDPHREVDRLAVMPLARLRAGAPPHVAAALAALEAGILAAWANV